MEEILVLATLCFMRAGNVILMCRFRVLKKFLILDMQSEIKRTLQLHASFRSELRSNEGTHCAAMAPARICHKQL